jgi:DNA processing protein
MNDQRLYWLGFSLVPRIGPGRLRKLLEVFESPEVAWKAPERLLRTIGLPRDALEGLIRLRRQLDLEWELERIRELGFDLLTWDDHDYPDRLRQIEYPPPVLYVRGQLTPQDSTAVAVVGTRRPTGYGRDITARVVEALAASGVTVVSGLARGTDGLAHKTALKCGGRTIAVLGSGLDQLYPPEHRHLAEEIQGAGAVITDYALGTRPEPGNFPPRNRIISGCSMAVVVVEAGEASGALITAEFAAEQGRDVFAVPGRIGDLKSRGTNWLISQGAFPLLSIEGLLEALNLEMVSLQNAASRVLPADPVERTILESLGTAPTHIDEISRKSGLEAGTISACLAMLELRGRVRQVGGMNYVLAHDPTPEYRVE